MSVLVKDKTLLNTSVPVKLGNTLYHPWLCISLKKWDDEKEPVLEIHYGEEFFCIPARKEILDQISKAFTEALNETQV